MQYSKIYSLFNICWECEVLAPKEVIRCPKCNQRMRLKPRLKDPKRWDKAY